MATRGPMTLRSGSLPKMVACVFISVPFFFLNHFLCWGVVVFLLFLLSLLLLRLLFGLSRFLIDAEAVSNRSVVVFCFFFNFCCFFFGSSWFYWLLPSCARVLLDLNGFPPNLTVFRPSFVRPGIVSVEKKMAALQFYRVFFFFFKN